MLFWCTYLTEGILQGREADHLRNADAGVDGEEAAAHQGGGGGRRQRHSRRIRLRHALRRDGQGVSLKLVTGTLLFSAMNLHRFHFSTDPYLWPKDPDPGIFVSVLQDDN